MDALSAGQYRQLLEIFRNLDTDGDGVIFARELQEYLHGFNEHFTLEEVEDLLKEHSVEKQGAIDFPQFINMLSLLMGEKEYDVELTEDDIRAVFESMDNGGKQFLTGNDIRTAMRMVGEKWTDTQINDMIYHRKADGRFYFDDFFAMIQPYSRLRKAREENLERRERMEERQRQRQAQQKGGGGGGGRKIVPMDYEDREHP